VKYLIYILLVFFSFNTFSYDFELEILSTRDARDLHIFKYSDTITYRQFNLIKLICRCIIHPFITSIICRMSK